MRVLRFFSIVVMAALFFSCSKANSKGNENSGSKSEFYTIKKETTDNGFRLVIVPKKGFHWNSEYPFKLKIIETKGATPEKKKYTKEDVKSEDQKGIVEVKCGSDFKNKKDVLIKGKMNFSVCNDVECKIFRNKEVLLKK